MGNGNIRQQNQKKLNNLDVTQQDVQQSVEKIPHQNVKKALDHLEQEYKNKIQNQFSEMNKQICKKVSELLKKKKEVKTNIKVLRQQQSQTQDEDKKKKISEQIKIYESQQNEAQIELERWQLEDKKSLNYVKKELHNILFSKEEILEFQKIHNLSVRLDQYYRIVYQSSQLQKFDTNNVRITREKVEDFKQIQENFTFSLQTGSSQLILAGGNNINSHMNELLKIEKAIIQTTVQMINPKQRPQLTQDFLQNIYIIAG